jgi:hypothetical protein
VREVACPAGKASATTPGLPRQARGSTGLGFGPTIEELFDFIEQQQARCLSPSIRNPNKLAAATRQRANRLPGIPDRPQKIAPAAGRSGAVTVEHDLQPDAVRSCLQVALFRFG